MSKPHTTHRLMCDSCHEVIAYYSFNHTERMFMDELGDILCPKCETKFNESDYLSVSKS